MIRVAALLVFVAVTAHAQRVHVASPRSTVAAYDSIVGVTATVYDSLGKRKAVPVTWTTRPRGAISILSDSTGHRVTIAGEQVGVSYAIATAGGVQDSVKITVGRPRVISVSAYWTFTRQPDGRIVGDSNRADTALGVQRCLYVVDRDRRGGAVTGLPYTVMSSNVSVARLSRSKLCPDTTVDPSRLVP